MILPVILPVITGESCRGRAFEQQEHVIAASSLER